jgi:magnesium transporter
VIRGQALNQINKRNLGDLLTREVSIGLLNGILWATIVAVLVWLWFGDAQIGLIIGIALVINMATAAYAGAMLPWFLRKIGVDPALAGGVALTTITDVVGLVAFLGLATLLL